MAAFWLSVQASSTGAQAQDGTASLACGIPYVIGNGDSLSSIAARAYGDPQRYGILLEANPGVIGPNPNAVVAGVQISIPCLDATGNVLTAGAIAGPDERMAAAVAAVGPLQPDELDALFAPVALFPDEVLTLVLVSTTFPLEIVKADRFLKDQAALPAKERAALAEQQPWDAGVRQLAAGFPDLIARMADQLDWTEQAGEAVIAQTDDVLEAVQRLRQKAQENGYLADNEAQTVTGGGGAIVIASATPGVVYVPTYDSQVVYTTPAPPTSVYSPYYYGYDDADWSDALAAGAIIFGGALVLDEIFDDNDWDGGWNDGGSIDWDRGDINIDRGDINIDRDNVTIGDGTIGKGGGSRPPLGSGERTALGDGTRPVGGAGGVWPKQSPGRVGGAEDAALAGRSATFAPDSASREVARQKIETRKVTNPGVASLPASRPAKQAATRPTTGAKTTKARPPTTARAQTASRPAKVSKPTAKRSPSSAASRTSKSSSSAFQRSGGSRASAGASRGRSSSGGGGGRRR